MANAFSLLPKAAFSGIEFPTESVRVKGGLRYHVHEYPHVPGGDAEKLGRRLYEVEMVANFQKVGFEKGQLSGFQAYGDLWPKRLAILRRLFEEGATRKLVIPTIGTIDAFCFDWDQEQTNKVLSGERATFRFIEDQDLQFLTEKLVVVKVQSLETLSKQYEVEAEKSGIDQDLTDQIVNAVNGVLAIADTADAYGNLLGAKIGMVAALCGEFDQRIDQFRDPSNHAALEALKELWAATVELSENVTGTDDVVLVYEVPRTMTISEVASAIYGNTERSVELMQINPIDDPFAIRPGTRVKYLSPQASQAA